VSAAGSSAGPSALCDRASLIVTANTKAGDVHERMHRVAFGHPVRGMENGYLVSKQRPVPPRDSVRSMSQQNVAVARRWVELFNARGDVDEFLSLHDPEVVLQTPGGPRLRGHDQVRDWFEAAYENVQPRILPERFVASGDTVVGLGRIEVRWIESGEVAHEGESAGVYWFRDGKISSWQPFETHAAALKESGLAED
jgi:ketosteroid isomerase-like protein